MRKVLSAAAVAAILVPITAVAWPARARPRVQVFLFVTQGVSYEQALADPAFFGLARAGGIGLLTLAEESGRDGFVTIAAGREASDKPTPGLLAGTVERSGRTVGYVGAPGPAQTIARDERGRIPLAVMTPRRVIVDPAVVGVVRRSDLVVAPFPRDRSVLARFLLASPAGGVVVIVVEASPSEAMVDRGDLVTPLIFARGPPRVLAREAARSGGPPARGLSSDTTRRDGIVSNVDVAPTVLSALGVSVPPAMPGAPIRIQGGPPTVLHHRYLVFWRAFPPTGLTVLSVALAALAAGLLLLARRRSAADASSLVGGIGLFAVAMEVATIPGAWLPPLSFPASLAPLAAIGAAITALALWRGRRSATGPVLMLAVATLGFVALDGALGWPAPWSALQGERFYGMGNPEAGFLLGAAVLAAAPLPVQAGTSLLVAAALFDGLPFLGADFGGGSALFLVAALWYVIRTRDRLGVRELAAVGAATLGWMALLVLAGHLPFVRDTHVTRAVQGAGGPRGLFAIFVDRFTHNVRDSARIPIVWPALLGVPVALAVAWRRLPPFRDQLLAHPAWRDAVVTLAVGAVAGYVLNDTHGTASIAFIFIVTALVYPAVARLRPSVS